MRKHFRSMAVAFARTTLLATLALTITPMLPSALSKGDRPAFLEEAEAALVADALLLEARALWESRPPAEMAEKGTRVFDPIREAARAFARASGSLIASGRSAGDDLMRTALAGPENLSSRMSLAASLLPPSRRLNTADEVEVASLDPDDMPGAGGGAGPALAYAPSSGPSVSSRFNDLLRGENRGFVPPIGDKDHAWAATPLPSAVFSSEEQTCLAKGIYFEARGETERGQEAVAQVILNRVRAPSYPDTICGVVYQNQHMRNRCQFSFVCDGIPDRITDRRSYAEAERIALAVTKGEIWLEDVGSATHYHATYVRPRWARAMEQVDKIGLHIFYRTFGGGWN